MDDREKKILCYCGGGLCCIGLLLMIILIPVSIKNVAHDEYAIRYDDLTNQIHTKVYTEGKFVCTPQTTMFVYPKTLQKLSLDFDCLSSNGIEMYVEVDIQYQIPEDEVFAIFDEFGQNSNLLSYLKLIAADSVRDSCGKYSAQNFYQERTVIQDTIQEDMIITAKTAKSHVNVTTVVLSNFEFPSGLDTAIKNKRASENDIEIAENERAGAITEAETALLTAEIGADKLAIEAQAEVAAIYAEAAAKATAIQQVWENRPSVYKSIKDAMGMTSTEFVYQYLTSVVLVCYCCVIIFDIIVYVIVLFIYSKLQMTQLLHWRDKLCQDIICFFISFHYICLHLHTISVWVLNSFLLCLCI